MTVEVSGETRHLIKTLGNAFVQRRDVKAVQHNDGSWAPDRHPWTLQDFLDHLSGKRTYGHYLLDSDDKTRLLAFDIDLRKPDPKADPPFVPMVGTDEGDPAPCNPRDVWLDENDPRWRYLCINLRCVAEGIALGAQRYFRCPVAIANSGGKGLHVYVFTGQRSAHTLRAAGRTVLDRLGLEPSRGDVFFRSAHWESNVEVEMFPKQDSLNGKDLGNLMKLPLGINRKTGNRSYFVRNDCPYDQLREVDPLVAMAGEAIR